MRWQDFAFFAAYFVTLQKIGCGSTIRASSITLALHYLYKTTYMSPL